jgi:hypothetical protein
MRELTSGASALAAAGILALSASAFAATPIYQWPAHPETLSYRINERVEASIPGRTIGEAVSGVIEEAIRPLAGDKAEVTVTYTGMKVQVGQESPQALTLLDGLGSSFVVTGAGQVLDVKPVGLSQLSSAQQKALSQELDSLESLRSSFFPIPPGTALIPGHSWTVHQSLNAAGVPIAYQARTTYLGDADGLLHLSTRAVVNIRPGKFPVSGTETVTGLTTLWPKSRFLQRAAVTESGNLVVTVPASASAPAQTVPEKVQVAMTVQEVPNTPKTSF